MSKKSDVIKILTSLGGGCTYYMRDGVFCVNFEDSSCAAYLYNHYNNAYKGYILTLDIFFDNDYVDGNFGSYITLDSVRHSKEELYELMLKHTFEFLLRGEKIKRMKK
jgi:hypothetical protein